MLACLLGNRANDEPNVMREVTRIILENMKI